MHGRLSRLRASGIRANEANRGRTMTALPATMTAIAIVGKGGPDVLQPTTVPVPQPGRGQVLIKVAAAGVNRPDVMQRLGLYPAPKGHSDIPGLEVSGTIAAVGAEAHRFKAGDKVMALVNGGGYAEYCLADEACCLPIPAGISMVEAAAIPEGFFTVWHNVFERGGLQAGRMVPHARRHQRHRRRRHPARCGLWRQGHRHGRLAREGRRLPRAGCHPRRRLQNRGLRRSRESGNGRPRCRRHSRHRRRRLRRAQHSLARRRRPPRQHRLPVRARKSRST